jgi:hypothetical protein
MRKSLSFVVVSFLLSCFHGYSQKGSIKGLLKDSTTKQILPLATVTVFKASDTSIITYRLSDPTGAFRIPDIPLNLNCRMIITHQGYTVYRKEFQLTKEESVKELGTIFLTHDAQNMEEVLVVAERPPVTMRNDTLEFNANAFKTLPSALVEDLLKKLPGVDVDLDGNITVKGRRVNRLLVDGKEFFGGDQKIATRNLPANIVDKVQVVDDKEEIDQNPLKPKEEIGQVINIKLKKAIKQGWFGKAYAGAGTDDRHEVGAIVNMFRDTTQVSLLGYSNNVNKSGFSFNDLQQLGGFNRSGANSISIWNEGGIAINGTSFGATGQGLQHSMGGGFNFNHQYTRKLTVNLQYFYGQINSQYENKSNSQRFFKDTILTTPSGNRYQAEDRNNRISSNIIWKKDSVTSFIFRPNLSITNNSSTSIAGSSTTDNYKGKVSANNNRNETEGKSYQYSHTLSFTKNSKKKRGRVLNISSNASVTDNDQDSFNEGLYTFYSNAIGRDSAINQYNNRINETQRIGLNVSFTNPLSKAFTLVLGQNTEYIKERSSLDFFQWDQTTGKHSVYSEPLSNGVKKQGWKNTFSSSVSYRYKKLTVTPGMAAQWLNFRNSFVKNPYVQQDFMYIYPTLSANWNSFSLSYRTNVTEPIASNLQQVIDISNPLYLRYGNPNLKPTVTRTASLSYYKYMQKTGNSLNLSLGSNFTSNGVISQTTWDARRVQTSRVINMDDTKSMYFSFSYNKQYKFNNNLKLSLRPNAYSSLSKTFVSLNGNTSGADYLNNSASLSTLLNYKDKIEWNQRYGISYNRTRYDDPKNFRNVNVTRYNTETELILRWPKHFVWETQTTYFYNPQVAPGIRKSSVRSNAAVNYLFLKEDKGQFKLSVFDLFNQNINVYRYASESSITDTQTTTLRRYFMLSFIYNIRNFSGGKVGGKDRTFGFW